MKFKRKKRPIHPSEQADGDYDGCLKSRRYEQQVRTKTGDDGIEETHVSYVERKGRGILLDITQERYDEIFKKTKKRKTKNK